MLCRTKSDGCWVWAMQGYDSDGNEVVPDKSGKIEPLKALDHDKIQYEPFCKDFYTPAADIAAMSEGKVHDQQRSSR